MIKPELSHKIAEYNRSGKYLHNKLWCLFRFDKKCTRLNNLHGNGHSWQDNGITKEKVLSVNSRIKEGSQSLWNVVQSKL